MRSASLTLPARLEPEDQARADCYALLSALYRAAPDGAFLEKLGAAPRLQQAPDQPFAVAYNRLLDASAAMDPDAARQEYDDIFVGVGKSEVDLHAAHWRSEGGSNRSLAELRTELSSLGLGRKPQSSLYEDHIAALCETMRLLISGANDLPPASLHIQRSFFERHIGNWADDLCNAINRCPLANYYRPVAEFTKCFVAVERDALAMD